MNVTLIGMPGVGKSTVGKIVADKLGYQFIDVDEVMEQSSGMPKQEILNILGDKGFVTLEEATIHDLAFMENVVFAPGGSVVYSKSAMATLVNETLIVYLKIALEELKKWNIDFGERGVVFLKEKGIDFIYKERVPLYERYAELTVEISSGYEPDLIAKDIVREALNRS